jgi:hypothetical protein
MSIEPSTGALCFDGGVRLEPSTTRSAFLLSALAEKAASKQEWAPAWFSCSLVAPMGNESWRLFLTFEAERLHDIRLALTTEATWESWSESAELAMQAKYSGWLDETLGSTRRDFPWGSVGAVFDRRAGSSWISVRYASVREAEGGPEFSANALT